MLKTVLCAAVVFLAGWAGTNPAAAVPPLIQVETCVNRITAGLDCFATDYANKDFSASPIPADFFDPGSAPFAEAIELVGVPIDPQDLGDTDTVVARLEDAVFPTGNSNPVAVTVRMETLSLRAAASIVVWIQGQPQLWDVYVSRDPGHEGCTGIMWIKKVGCIHGTYNATLCVPALFTFVRQSDGAVRELVHSVAFPRGPDVPWVRSVNDPSKGIVACDNDFVPGVGIVGITPQPVPVPLRASDGEVDGRTSLVDVGEGSEVVGDEANLADGENGVVNSSEIGISIAEYKDIIIDYLEYIRWHDVPSHIHRYQPAHHQRVPQ